MAWAMVIRSHEGGTLEADGSFRSAESALCKHVLYLWRRLGIRQWILTMGDEARNLRGFHE